MATNSKKGLVQDKRFQHVHTDPRFQRAAKEERKFTPDARFQKMFTDKQFNENYKVDAWGRKIDTGNSSNELLKYYDMDEATKAAVTGKGKKKGKAAPAAAAAAAAASAPAKKQTKKQAASTEEEDDEEDAPPAAGKKKAAASKKGQKQAAPVDDDDDEDDYDGEEGFDGNFLSSRGMAPPSSGEDDDDENGSDGSADGVDDDDDDDDEDGDANDGADVDDEPETSDDEDEAVQMEDAFEEEEIPTGEETESYRRLAVMNLEWDRLRAVDLLVLFRSFVPQPAGTVTHPIRSVKVYPSEFGRQRMADEAKYGPTNIYAGNLSAEAYKQKLEAKMSRVQAPIVDDEEDEEEGKPEEEDESERSSDDEDEGDDPKRKRVSFPIGTKNSKKTKSAITPTPTPAKPKNNKNKKADDDLDEATDDILSRPSFDDADDDGDDDASDSASNGSEDSGAEFDAEKLRQYELERLKYYYAIVDCDTPNTAEQLYRGCDGLEFEHSSNLIDLRYVPDDVSFEEDEPFLRDSCFKVPTNYKAPEFYTQALQHTNVQLTWDRDDPTRVKLLSKKFVSGEDEATQDLKAYLGSDDEEDGYGSDAVTEASDSGSDDGDDDGAGAGGNSDDDGEKPTKTKKKVTLKRKARSKYLALLNELKAPVDGDEDGEDNHEVTITFEPGLKAKGEAIAAKALNKGNEIEGESTWEKHLRERLEKKKAKKKARKEKLKGLNGDEEGAGGNESDSGDEIGGKNAKMQSDLYEDDDVEYDADDAFFQLSDEDLEPAPAQKKKAGKKSQDDDDDDDDAISMSSESGEDGPDDDDDDDDESMGASDDDIDALQNAKAKANRMFDDSAPKPKAKPADKKAADKKRKRSNDDDDDAGVADDDSSRKSRAQEQAELELLMMDEGDENEDGQKGYSLQSLLKAKKLSNQAEAGGKKKKRKGTNGDATAAVDTFTVDTKDERFGALFSNSAFSIDPTHPSFKQTEGTDQLLHEKARRRQEQEKEQAKEIARRKEQAKKAAGGNKSNGNAATPAAAAAASTDSTTGPSNSAHLASLVASVKRKTHAVTQSKKPAVVAVGKNAAPASKRSKPEANF